MKQIVLQSPAKLNLYLKVVNKRPDGFHNICTVFQRIDLADQIKLRPLAGGKIRIHCSHPDVPVGPKNLVYKATQCLQRDFGIKKGVEFHIRKNIPVAAGLAGGSSNAATALLGLNRIWGLRLTKPQLLAYARAIGSDVAFFLHNTSWALGTERGDRIKNLKIDRKLWQILVVPRIKIYSSRVYGRLKLHLIHSNPTFKNISRPMLRTPHRKNVGCTNVLTKKIDNANILIRNLKKGSTLDIGHNLANDLENQVFRLAPSLVKLKERLKSLNTKGVMVSGSGPGVFGLTATRQDAEHIKSILSKRFSQVFVVRTL